MLSLILFSSLVYYAERGAWKDELVCETEDGFALVVRAAGYYREGDCIVSWKESHENEDNCQLSSGCTKIVRSVTLNCRGSAHVRIASAFRRLSLPFLLASGGALSHS